MGKSSKPRDGLSFSDAGKLGYSKSKETHVKKYNDRINEYDKNPNKCKQCKNDLSYKQRHNKFCSQSCSASHNNKGIRRHGKEPKKCEQCGKPTKNQSNRFCSTQCYRKYSSLLNENLKDSIKCFCGRTIKGLKSSFCSAQCYHNNNLKIKYQKMIDKNIKIGPRSLRTVLLYNRGRQCELCGITEWQGQPVPVVIDHIDGHSNNNIANNLRVICCNCDALLPTYKSKNKNSDRSYRRRRYAEGKTY